MPEEQFKRNVAYKLRIGDILSGKPVIENEKFTHLNLNGKRVVRVNVVASIVDKYVVDEEKKYVFITLDDASGQTKLKVFGDDIEKIKDIEHGKTVIVIGVLRYFNDEIYISPETVKETDPRYLVVRKLELEKANALQTPNQNSQPNKEVRKDFREKITDLIKNAEAQGGIEKESIISQINEIPKEQIETEIQKLLEEGTVFEPRPNVIRWLG
ncbi:MAG: OB-fold nucleic acid binding domain-containing protein [Candidatus Pacearchaeota archaeon]